MSKLTITSLLPISTFTHHTTSTVPLTRPLFGAVPEEVVFGEYEPFGIYTGILFMFGNES